MCILEAGRVGAATDRGSPVCPVLHSSGLDETQSRQENDAHICLHISIFGVWRKALIALKRQEGSAAW